MNTLIVLQQKDWPQSFCWNSKKLWIWNLQSFLLTFFAALNKTKKRQPKCSTIKKNKIAHPSRAILFFDHQKNSKPVLLLMNTLIVPTKRLASIFLLEQQEALNLKSSKLLAYFDFCRFKKTKAATKVFDHKEKIKSLILQERFYFFDHQKNSKPVLLLMNTLIVLQQKDWPQSFCWNSKKLWIWNLQSFLLTFDFCRFK